MTQMKLKLTKQQIFKNKKIAGNLTMGDIHDIVKSGEYRDLSGNIKSRFEYQYYSIGKHWIPITLVHKSKEFIQIWTGGPTGTTERRWLDKWDNADICIPINSIVEVKDNFVSLELKTNFPYMCGYSGDKEFVTLKIDLSFAPFQ